LQTQSNFRLLVVRLGAMGDILHALPAVTALRQAHPEWVIDWVVEPRWSALLSAEETREEDPIVGDADEKPLSGAKAHAGSAAFAARLKSCPDTCGGFEKDSSAGCKAMPLPNHRNPAQPLVDHLHFAPTKDWGKAPLSGKTFHEIKTLRAALRAGEYDAAIDLQGAIRSAVVARLAGCRRVIGEAEPRELPARWLFGERVATHGAHVVEQDVELAEAIAGDKLAPVHPWLPVDPAAEAWAAEILPANTGARGGSQPSVLINPGAGWGAKRWPVQRYDAVAQGFIDLGFRILVNAGPGEENLAEVIARGTGGAAIPLACTLAQLIAVTRRVALVVAGDTGPLHLACALGRPVVGIYGPTDPSRNGPFGTRYRVIRNPQSRRDHTRRESPERGLLTIQPDDVLRAAEALFYPETAPETHE
jgi:heptosyltransferase-1